MKQVIIAIQNTFVCEAVVGALRRKGFFTEKSLSHGPPKIAAARDVYLGMFCYGNTAQRTIGTLASVSENGIALRQRFRSGNCSKGEARETGDETWQYRAPKTFVGVVPEMIFSCNRNICIRTFAYTKT